MKKVILSVLGLTLLAGCSGYDYYKTDVRYRQKGKDCVYYYDEKGKQFNEEIKNPICTLTFKTIRGVDVTGTNTMIEQRFIEKGEPGDVYVVTYEQQMNLQGGEYLISMSCTGFENGNLTAYHRCYDLISINVISDKDTVGFFDMNSIVIMEKQ